MIFVLTQPQLWVPTQCLETIGMDHALSELAKGNHTISFKLYLMPLNDKISADFVDTEFLVNTTVKSAMLAYLCLVFPKLFLRGPIFQKT